MSFTRFAVYYVPPEGALADFGARWLGWDIAEGAAVDQPHLPGLHDITMTPRKYGFHGTLKPPFRLAGGTSLQGLQAALTQIALKCAPARCDGLSLTRLGHFLALTPAGDASGIARVAATCVSNLDEFRAPADAAELERRRKAGLSERQDANLRRWGYPYVMEDFRFHLTLTGRLEPERLDHWAEAVKMALPVLPEPFAIDSVALVGEREDGRFELIQRYTLAG